jgi:hypothetical protein
MHRTSLGKKSPRKRGGKFIAFGANARQPRGIGGIVAGRLDWLLPVSGTGRAKGSLQTSFLFIGLPVRRPQILGCTIAGRPKSATSYAQI